MKTLSLQGMQEQFEYLYKEVTLEDKDNNLIPTEIETRVYVLDILGLCGLSKPHALTDEEFQTLAEEQGRVYTLKGFQEAFNLENIDSEIDVIRFINTVNY